MLHAEREELVALAHEGVGVVGKGYGISVMAEEEREEARDIDCGSGKIGGVADEGVNAVEGLEAGHPLILVGHIDVGGKSLATEELTI